MRHNTSNNQKYTEELNFNSSYTHLPVLVREIASYIKMTSGKSIHYLVDATLGEGGHSEFFLSTYSNLKIIAFEQDQEILAIAQERLKNFSDRIEYVNENFSEAPSYLKKKGLEVDYFFYDFGISSYHFDKSQRGFAFKQDEELDMRLSQNLEVKAADILNTYPEKKLADLFYNYGEERKSRQIASYLCRERQRNYISTTQQLASLVLRVLPHKNKKNKIHPATRVFQALRIEVNNELQAIENGLAAAIYSLAPGGRILAISFHSLEDRIVKEQFKKWSKGCQCNQEGQFCLCSSKPLVKILTKKPISPLEDEIEKNYRSRSAKLRVVEKASEEESY